MPVTYRIDADERIVHLTMTGECSYDEWERAMLAALADPSYRPGFGFLIDRRGADITTPDFIRRVVCFNLEHQVELGGGRRAVVVGSTADYGMGRMAEILSDDSPSPIRVFKDIDEALGWLRAGDHGRRLQGPDVTIAYTGFAS
jgi:hypothetical protein